MQQGWSRSGRLFMLIAALYWLGGMHFFMHNPGGSGFYLPFNMVGWLFAALLIGVGLWHVTLSHKLVLSANQGWLWAGFLVLCIPLFTHPDVPLDAGMPRLLGIAGGLLLLFALTQLRLTASQRLLMFYLLLGAVAVEALFGLVQYFWLTPGNWIGYNTLTNRPYGIFQKDSVLSSFVALGATLALFLSLWDPQAGSGWRRWLCHGVLFAAGLLLVVIQSRSGQGGLLLSALILFPLLFVFDKRRALWALAALLLGLLAGAISFAILSTGRGLASYVGTMDYRLLYWRHCLDLFWQQPWLGVGYGKFESAFVTSYYASPSGDTGKTLIEQNLDHPHNELLYWLVEGGLVALLGLGLAALGWLRMLWSQDKCRALALLALPLPLLFHAMVEYPFYHSVAHWFALIWLLWFTDAERAQSKVLPLRNWLLLRALALLIPLLTVPYMLTGLQTAYLVTKFERGGLKEPALLEQVINPLPWYSRFMYDVMTVRLMYGLQSNHPDELKAYVDWAKDFVSLMPRANVYNNLAMALHRLNRPDEALQWRAEGQRLFPADPLFQVKPSAAVSVTKPAMSPPAQSGAVAQ
ncbi:Wzy polymerase domain-containing protein [Pseudaeromonas sp. ZJS20]|uniref:PglL family O-oligosaccharyltransferase n=1 Tax=Pseudaeromonas aegiceratis TaxID=3153928 RepID=UPI00390C60E5